MFALRVVEELNVFEDVAPSIIACRVGFSPDPLAFQQLEEAFRNGVVMTVTTSAHAGFEVVLAQKRLPFPTGELGPLIGMHCDRSRRFAPPDGHQQGPEREVCCHARLGGPSDHTAREQVNDDTQV